LLGTDKKRPVWEALAKLRRNDYTTACRIETGFPILAGKRFFAPLGKFKKFPREPCRRPVGGSSTKCKIA
jgi:hypothetical protein